MSKAKPRRWGWIWGGVIVGVFLGFLLAFMLQFLFPTLAKLPGVLFCGDTSMELVRRRRTSYATCGADTAHVIGYGKVLMVSWLVWSIAMIPVGLWLSRWVAQKAQRGPRSVPPATATHRPKRDSDR